MDRENPPGSWEPPDRESCERQAYFCEESIWRLCSRCPNRLGAALFFTNKTQALWMAEQSAGRVGEWIAWDYHVVLLAERIGINAGLWIFDLDSRLPWPCALSDYLARSFPDWDDDAPPCFATFECSDFSRRFWSDRSHMLDSNGNWLALSPPWPAPSASQNRLTLEQCRDAAVRPLVELVRARSLGELL